MFDRIYRLPPIVRVWNYVLKSLGIKHRSLYKIRHTAITHALDTLDAKDVAHLVENSADVIYKVYAGIKEGLELPDFHCKYPKYRP
jgi:integrase